MKLFKKKTGYLYSFKVSFYKFINSKIKAKNFTVTSSTLEQTSDTFLLT